MRQPYQWAAELEITPEAAARLIAEQFPQLATVKCELLGVGWDNVALLVNGQFVFRFPRRKMGADLLPTELRLLPAIAPRLPLPISAPIFEGKPSENFPWPFAGYRVIPGKTACRMHLGNTERHALAPALGRFLRALHDIRPDLASDHGAGFDAMRRLDIPYRSAQTIQRLAYLSQHHLFDLVQDLLAIVRTVPTNYSPRQDVLVHGDLYSRHLIIDDAGQLVGVIDWGDMHLGDPATDLMVGWILFPPNARPAFFDAYGKVDSTVWQIARFRALNHTVCTIPYAHQTRDDELLAACLLGLKYLVSEW